MKTLSNLSSGSLRAVALGVLLSMSILMPACKKNNNNIDIEPAKATVSIVNAGVPSIDFYLENSKVNPAPILYSENTGYLELIAGTRGVTIIKGGSVSNADILAAGYVLFEGNKNYSIFISRESAASQEAVIGLIVEDDLTAPSAGKAKIRFANQTPDAPAMDVLVKGGAAIFTNKEFTTVSEFIVVDPASAYVLEIHQTGNSTVKFEIPAFNVEANKIYTVYSNGLWAGTVGNDAFSAHVIVNK